MKSRWRVRKELFIQNNNVIFGKTQFKIEREVDIFKTEGIVPDDEGRSPAGQKTGWVECQ